MDKEKNSSRTGLSEDWISVILAFLLIVFAAIGLLGKNGIPVNF